MEGCIRQQRWRTDARDRARRSRLPSFEHAVSEVVQRSKRIDNLFNNAGIGVPGEVDSYTLDQWERLRPMAPEKFAARTLGVVAPALSMSSRNSRLTRIRELDSRGT
jgi:NADP-dependent 3-hydroxy acid dehydrogenase YdfG